VGEIFNIRMETDLTEWDDTVLDGGDGEWAAAAGLGGSSGGLSVTIDSTDVIYGDVDFTALSYPSYIRSRFYVDPNGLSMSNGNSFRLAQWYEGSYALVLSVELRQDSGTQYIRTMLRDDGYSNHYGGDVELTDAEHYVEVRVVRASTTSSNDGSVELYLDGVLEDTLSGQDIYNRVDWEHARLGACYGPDTGTSGTFYIDEFVLRDDDTEIGALDAGSGSIGAIAYDHNRRKAA